MVRTFRRPFVDLIETGRYPVETGHDAVRIGWIGAVFRAHRHVVDVLPVGRMHLEAPHESEIAPLGQPHQLSVDRLGREVANAEGAAPGRP